MQRGESGNPFGGEGAENQLDPRGFAVNLDRDTLYSSWFDLADTGENRRHVIHFDNTHGLCNWSNTYAANSLPIFAIVLASSKTEGLCGCADHDNKLTGPDAVKFFERSGLPRPVLAKVWALADSSRKGYLDPATFTKACLCCVQALQRVKSMSVSMHVHSCQPFRVSPFQCRC